MGLIVKPMKIGDEFLYRGNEYFCTYIDPDGRRVHGYHLHMTDLRIAVPIEETVVVNARKT